MCGDFSTHANYPLWGAKPTLIIHFGEPSPHDFALSTKYGVWDFWGVLTLWHPSPTSAREAPHACLISPWSKAWCTTTPQSGTPSRAYKACMRRFSCRYGTRVSQDQSTPKIPNPVLGTESKTVRAWLPKAGVWDFLGGLTLWHSSPTSAKEASHACLISP